MQRLTTTIVVAFVLTFGALAIHTPTTSAQDPGMLVISKDVCPPAGPGDDIDPTACTEAAAGVEFFIATPNTDNVEFGATGGDGLVSFPLEPFVLGPESVVSVGEILAENPIGEIASYHVDCTKYGEALAFEYEQVEVAPGGPTYGIRFNVESGDQIACEWYNAPLSTDPVDPGEGDQNGDPVDQLPATGAGVTAGFPIDQQVRVDTAALNVRSGPGLGTDIINVLPSGYVAFITDGPVPADGYTWYQVDAMGVTLGWVAGEFLAPVDDNGNDFPIDQRVVVDTEALNVRSAPGLGAEVVNVLPTGYVAFISDGPVAVDGYTWYQVDAMGVTLGWVAGEFLAPA